MGYGNKRSEKIREKMRKTECCHECKEGRRKIVEYYTGTCMFRIVCRDCGAYAEGASLKKAIKRWNKGETN